MADVKPVRVLSDLEATQDVIVSGSLFLTTTSSFSIAAIATGSNGSYDVDVLLHSIDNSLLQFNANIANAIAGVVDEYNKNRYTFAGALDSTGSARINLTDSIVSGSVSFSSGNLLDIAVDLMLDTNGDGKYKNDLTSYEIYTSGSKLFVGIDAPASPNSNYRLIVTNNKSMTPLSGSNGLYIIAGPQGPQGSAGTNGAAGADAKTYITIASLLSTTNTLDTVASNFSLSPSKAPNGFAVDVTGFTQNSSYPMVLKLYDLNANVLLDSNSINTVIPSTVRLNGIVPAVSNNQYELRYYSSGSSGNYVYLQTAIVEI